MNIHQYSKSNNQHSSFLQLASIPTNSFFIGESLGEGPIMWPIYYYYYFIITIIVTTTAVTTTTMINNK